MTGKTTVAFFHIDSKTLGGGSKMLLRLLKDIDKDQFEPILVLQAKGEVYETAKEIGVEIKVVSFPGILDTYNRQLVSSSPLVKLAAGGRILQYNLRSRGIISRADIIWADSLRMVLTLIPTALMPSKPMIWNIGLGMKSEGAMAYLNEIALRASDYVFIESEEQAKRVFTGTQYDRHREQFTIFHKGVDVEEFNPDRFGDNDQMDGYRIGTAASLTSRKGIEYLIDALPTILAEHSDVELTIAGEAPEGNEEYAAQLKKKVRDHRIEDQVKFLGWVDDMPRYLSTLDVFILPSLNEGIPGAVREALAMEIPVIATDVGGTADVVIDGETGYLVSTKDAEEISDCVLYLFNNKSMLNSFGEKGRNLIEESFSVKSYIDNYELFLNQISK